MTFFYVFFVKALKIFIAIGMLRASKMAAGSSGAVAAIYLCMIVLNLKPLCSYTTHLAPMLKQHVEDTSLSAPATLLNIKHFGHGRHIIYSSLIWHSWQTLSNTKKGLK